MGVERGGAVSEGVEGGGAVSVGVEGGEAVCMHIHECNQYFLFCSKTISRHLIHSS